MTKNYLLFFTMFMFITACSLKNSDEHPVNNNDEITLLQYFDQTGRDDVLSGGIKMFPIETKSGTHKVWTKRIGNNPDIKVLILHGGPGASHTYLECFDSFFPGAGIEYYYYDQLESGYSDRPNDTSLWHLDRFVDEVEQVRKALGLNKDNFYLYGQSWGGILGIEYALKYQQHLKGLIISNMVSSIPDYNKYANEVLGPQLNKEVLAEIKAIESTGDFENPRYMELIAEHYYPKHILRMPLDEWPEPVVRDFDNTNTELYVTMQGPSEFGSVGETRLADWDRNDELSKIEVPALTIGGAYDTMDPEHMEWMAEQMENGTYLYCPNGSHLAMYDDQDTYFEGLIEFIINVHEQSIAD